MGIDDPAGLPIVLGMEVERQDQAWHGRCTLEVIGLPMRVAPKVQHETFRITREAITNAIKHADATSIGVKLCYPASSFKPICITISDDGRRASTVAPHASQRGLRYMRESARTAGGELSIQIQAQMSTTIVFSFPGESAATASDERYK